MYVINLNTYCNRTETKVTAQTTLKDQKILKGKVKSRKS